MPRNCLTHYRHTGALSTNIVQEGSFLVKSNYLRVLKSSLDDSFFLYHSLFGNLHRADTKCIEILELFAKPATPNSIVDSKGDDKPIYELLEELLSLYYLVPKDFDERLIAETEIILRGRDIEDGKLISAIQLNVSEGCNLKCTYCFADRVDERASLFDWKKRNDEKIMSFETAIQSIQIVTELVQSHGKDSLVLKFFGREPLLNWTVIDQVINYCEASKQYFNYYYTITTNGTLFTPEIVSRLKEVSAMIVISLDGFGTANLLRLSHSGKESFSAVNTGLEMLKEQGVSCKVASVLSDHNFDLLGEEFLNYLKERLVKEWEVKLLMQNDNDRTYARRVG